MADIFGAAAAVITLLGQSIDLIERVKIAREASTNHQLRMDDYIEDLRITAENLKMVQENEHMWTDHVKRCVAAVGKRANLLDKHLQDMDRNGFWHKFKHGKTEEKSLQTLMENLRSSKVDLISATLQVFVGVNILFLANKPEIERIDAELRDVRGDNQELMIAKIIKHKVPDVNGYVSLTENDLESAEHHRVIERNTAHDRATMLNGPIGQDIWSGVGRIRIMDNVARGQSMMVNHGQTQEVFDSLMERSTQAFFFERLMLLLYVLVAIIAFFTGRYFLSTN